MRNLSISIVLRILLITSFALVAYMQVKEIQLSEMFLNDEISYEYYKENEINTSVYGLIFVILALINSWYTQLSIEKTK